MTKTVAINVTWLGNLSDDSAKDGTDLAAAGSNLSIPVILKARQKLATTNRMIFIILSLKAYKHL